MFEACIREGKALPDFTHTDEWQVSVTLHGQLVDASFVKFLERIGRETKVSFGLQDFLVFDLVHREQRVPGQLRPALVRLRELGLVEAIGRGRGVRYLLGRSYYEAIGQRGAYTRLRGLDEAASRELLMQHLRGSGTKGCPFAELQQVLPAASPPEIRRMLRWLREEGRVRRIGGRRFARWAATPDGETA